MNKSNELPVGTKFGKLTITGPAPHRGCHRRYECLCDCGKTTVATHQTIVQGTTRTCGCGRANTNGIMTTLGLTVPEGARKEGRLFRTWYGMHWRCHRNHHYASKGITVCDEWRDYGRFAKWARANGYSADLTIDRLSNDLGYTPGNCRWADLTTQTQNREKCITISQVIEIRTRYVITGQGPSAIAKDMGISVSTVGHVCRNRTWRGYGIEGVKGDPIEVEPALYVPEAPSAFEALIATYYRDDPNAVAALAARYGTRAFQSATRRLKGWIRALASKYLSHRGVAQLV